jgi:hypothetical protein
LSPESGGIILSIEMSETRVTHEAKLDMPKECDHIVGRALAGEDAIVQMGCLMLSRFPAATRSRWISTTKSHARCVSSARNSPTA